MPGPQPKDPSRRARRNKTSTRAVLRAVENPEIPDLPEVRDWHSQVLDWWERAWESPMSSEWTTSDIDVMYLAAGLMQEFWSGEARPADMKSIASEVRQLLGQCGLTPMSRRSLQWEIDRGEEASERTAARRSVPPKPILTKAQSEAADPRRGISAV